MKHDKIGERDRAAKRDRIIRTAEWVLLKAYRASYRKEILESQFRIKEGIIREMRRRAR
ncbi:hypothetical protein [Roseivivax sp. CAU 1761]